MKKLLFVFNPHSVTGKINKSLSEALDTFTKAGYETVAYPTQSAGTEKKKSCATVCFTSL